MTQLSLYSIFCYKCRGWARSNKPFTFVKASGILRPLCIDKESCTKRVKDKTKDIFIGDTSGKSHTK